MLAYGKLDRNLMAKGYFQGCLGFEFSGTALSGRERRVMGVARRALATQVCAQDDLVSVVLLCCVLTACASGRYCLLIRQHEIECT